MVTTLTCAGCGAVIPDDEPLPFACPNARRGDDHEHIVVRRLDAPAVWNDADADPNPFARYRRRLHSHHRAVAAGLSDGDYVALVRRIDDAILAVDGRQFRTTPLRRESALAAALGFSPDGAVWVKNETGNVSGSHKARHLMGIALHLAAMREAGQPGAFDPSTRRLGIASCGNAGLAAAVVARACGYGLDVFIPVDADPNVVERLGALGARLVRCPRCAGEVGDPCYLRLLEALGGGALPFTCQGPDNGLTIEGGETLAYELVDQLASAGANVDRIFVQVGGAALASACAAGLAEARAAGVLDVLPRFHTVQTFGAYPLGRAYELLAARIDAALGGARLDTPTARAIPSETFAPATLAAREGRAERIRDAWSSLVVQETLAEAATHRSAFMWPWEDAPHSVAHGILDDETYDWLAVVRAMLESGGFPLVVDEALLREANDLARAQTGIPADHTGTSGLAGLLQARRAGIVGLDASVVVLFTGIDRAVEAAARA